MKKIFFVLIIAIVLIALFPLLQVSGNQWNSCVDCNILVFTVDTLRADHLSSYGFFKETTPRIDELANDGIKFTNAFSQIPHTPPSHWSIFTGIYPYKHKKFDPSQNGTELTAVYEILKENGYTTSGFVGSKVLKRFDTEFDYFNGKKNGTMDSIKRPASEITEEAVTWLDNHSSERFFMWVHYYDPHSPYDPPEEFDLFDYSDDDYFSDDKYSQKGLSGNSVRDDLSKYDGEILYTDYNIGTILDRLEELDLDKKTVVIFLSDHGECFADHMFSDFGYKREDPCIFHGKTLYDEEIHIPLIIKNPMSDMKGFEFNEIVETVDIFSTILDILNITNNVETDGESIVPLIKGGTRQKDYTISQTRPRNNNNFSVAIRTNDWKFVNVRPSDYDIDHDIAEQEGIIAEDFQGMDGNTIKLLLDVNNGEKNNYYSSDNEIAQNLESKLIGIFSGINFDLAKMDEDSKNILKSLGYIT